jgi:hypothetical protein
MLTSTRSTAIGVFPDRARAEQAVDELRRAGFRMDQVGFVARNGTGLITDATETEVRAESGAAAGAVTGGLLGALLGGVAALSIPGIGPVLAAGLLAGVLSGTAAGAWGGGLLGALVGLALPEEEARHYQEEVRAGRTLVTVEAGDRYVEAVDILSRCGGTYLEPSTTAGA